MVVRNARRLLPGQFAGLVPAKQAPLDNLLRDIPFRSRWNQGVCFVRLMVLMVVMASLLGVLALPGCDNRAPAPEPVLSPADTEAPAARPARADGLQPAEVVPAATSAPTVAPGLDPTISPTTASTTAPTTAPTLAVAPAPMPAETDGGAQEATEPTGAAVATTAPGTAPGTATPEPTAIAATTAAPEPTPVGELSTSAADPPMPEPTPGPATEAEPEEAGDHFIDVTAGGDHSCGLRANGTVLCWGRGMYGENDPPEGSYKAVSAGDNYSCGIRTEGTVTCWGIWGVSYGMYYSPFDSYRRPEAPAGVFKAISAGGAHACGIRANDTVACWGANIISAGDFAREVGQATPPEGTFRSISASGGHTCGVTTGGKVVCWGAGYEGATSPVEGDFLSVSAGGRFNCGVKTDHSLHCWGDSPYGEITPPDGEFVSVSASNINACGVRTTGEVECWGYHLKNVPPQGEFVAVSAAPSHRCAARADGVIACWGHNFFGQLGFRTNIICGVLPNRNLACPGEENYELLSSVHGSDWVSYYHHNGSVYPCGDGPDGAKMCWDPYEGRFAAPAARKVVEFSAYRDTACWRLADLTIGCWGGAVFDSPGGAFQSVDVGEAVYLGFACGVRTSGELECWGGNGHDWGTIYPPEGTFKSVSLAFAHGCALRTDDTVACWGSTSYNGRGNPPDGTFKSLEGGGVQSHCGIRPDSTMECWGNAHNLPGVFRGLSVAGSSHGDNICGVRADRTVICWSSEPNTVSIPVSGRFESVSAGGSHSCGVRVGGTVACWGSNTNHDGEYLGQAEPPPGQFLSVSVGDDFTCGIRRDSTLACWGNVPGALQNMSGIVEIPVKEETEEERYWSLPLREQLDLEKAKPGSLAAKITYVTSIYRFAGIMTKAERAEAAEEIRLYLEGLGPPKGEAELHTSASIWLGMIRAIDSSVREYNDYYTAAQHLAMAPFYVYTPEFLPPGFGYDGASSDGGGQYGILSSITINFSRTSETYPLMESGQVDRITIIKGNSDIRDKIARPAYQDGKSEEVRFPHLEEAGARPARYWVDETLYRARGQAVHVTWENPGSGTFTLVISDVSVQETMEIIRSFR